MAENKTDEMRQKLLLTNRTNIHWAGIRWQVLELRSPKNFIETSRGTFGSRVGISKISRPYDFWLEC